MFRSQLVVMASIALAACGDADPGTRADVAADTSDIVIADTTDIADADAADDARPETRLDTAIDSADSDAHADAEADAAPSDSADGADSGPDVVAPDAVMRLHVLDVGQGDSMIVELPCGAMLVDTGGEVTDAANGAAGFDSDDALEAQIDAFFAARPDLHATFDVVVLTHPHLDHTRGVTRLLAMVAAGKLTIRHVLTNGDDSGNYSGSRQQRDLQDYADAHPDTISRWYVLQRLTGATGTTNDVIDPFGPDDCAASGGLDPKVTALWGRIDDRSPLVTSWDPDDVANANNNSVVLRVALGQASMLLTGDLERPGIAALLAQYAGTGLLDVDLYKVAHHGSYTGTTAAEINALSPRVAVISAGPADRVGAFTAYAFGHPRASVIDDLAGDTDSDGVSDLRPTAIDALVATGYADGHGIFASRHVAPAIYCTGWERHAVVVTLHANGAVDLP